MLASRIHENNYDFNQCRHFGLRLAGCRNLGGFPVPPLACPHTLHSPYISDCFKPECNQCLRLDGVWLRRSGPSQQQLLLLGEDFDRILPL